MSRGSHTLSLELRSGPTRDRTVGVIRAQMTLEPQEWTRLPGKGVGRGGRQSPGEGSEVNLMLPPHPP